MKNHCRYLLMLAICCAVLLVPELQAAEKSAENALSPVAAVGFAKSNADCLACHADKDLRTVTPSMAPRDLFVPEKGFSRSVHGNMNCLLCHAPLAKAEDFGVIPHVQNIEALPSCMNCHDKRFAHVSTQLEASTHTAKLGNAVTCVSCHNPHTQQRVEAMDSYTASVSASNAVCLDCHTSHFRYMKLSDKAVYSQNLSHNFMPQAEKHLSSIRCIECHTPIESYQPHAILPKEKALRDCAVCHQQNSFFVQRVSGYAHDAQGPNSLLNKGLFDDAELLRSMQEAKTDTTAQVFANHTVSSDEVKAAFADRYVPGFGQTADVDTLVVRFWLAIVGLCVLHALARVPAYVRRSRDEASHEGGAALHEKFYPHGIRLLHWTNAVLFAVLLATGFSIHYPECAVSLPLEGSTSTHDVAGLLLIANFAAFVLYSVLSGEIRQYLPAGGFVCRMFSQLRYYLFGIFTGAEKPFAATPANRLNPVQQLTYLLVYCLGMPVLLASGVVLLVPELAAFVPLSARTLASIHFVLAAGYLGFVVLHVYMTTTGKRPFSLLKSMLTGKHYE